MPESKEATKNYVVAMSKEHRHQHEGAPTGQRQNDVSKSRMMTMN